MPDDPNSESNDRGAIIVRTDVVGTVVFALTAIVAATTFASAVRAVAAAVALTLFFLGIAAFLWAFWNVVQRSRTEQISVTQVYLHVGGVVPAKVRTIMAASLATQCIVGLGTALARSNNPDGRPGTSLALGVLVPIFGFGLNGLWTAFHGRFAERDATGATTGVKPDGRATEARIDQNERHG